MLVTLVAGSGAVTKVTAGTSVLGSFLYTERARSFGVC